MVRLIHITPELPPTVGGVADYTNILTRRLVEVSGGQVEPVLVHAGKEAVDHIEVDFPVVDLSGKQSADALADVVQRLVADAEGQAVVLLEYSGHGYAKRGAPFWLAQGIKGVCTDEGVPLFTFFHELYATGKLWEKTFWWSFIQQWIVRRISSRSTAVITNRPDSARWLKERTEEGSVYFCPVFSNVEEPDEVLETRGNFAVVFGATGKEKLYRNHGAALDQLLQQTGINTIVDIGPQPPEYIQTEIEHASVEAKGCVPSSQVSAYLKQASVGFVLRNPVALTKSGILAAYMVHGVPTVVVQRYSTEPNEILVEGGHYTSLNQILNAEGDLGKNLERIGRKGREWYFENAHSRRTAETVLNLINQVNDKNKLYN